jgi:hypothetical protein
LVRQNLKQSRILTRFSKIKGIKIENIFDCDKSTINRSLNDFSKLKGVSPALIAETKKFYSDLYDYKKVLMPINIDNKVEVAVHKNEINKPKTYMRDGIVKKMRWSLDEDGRLGCQFLVLPEREQMSKWRSIDDFGVELFDKTIKISNIGKENDLVKMHKFGYMKPVVIAGDKQMICVDNASLYVGSNIKGLREIGMWEGNNIKTAELASITEENLLELLKSYRPYLAVVRRRMAPYLVSEPTITRVSDLMA